MKPSLGVFPTLINPLNSWMSDMSLNRSLKAPRKSKKERAPTGKWHLIGNSQTSVTPGDKRKKHLHILRSTGGVTDGEVNQRCV